MCSSQRLASHYVSLIAVGWILGLWPWVTLPARAASEIAIETIRLTNGPVVTVQVAHTSGKKNVRRPAILTLGSIKPDAMPGWSTNLLEDGFALVAFTAEYPPDPNPARRPVWLHFDPRFAHSYVLGGVRTPQDTHRVINYLEGRADIDVERIGWLGSSTTGIFGLAAATREPRIKAIVAFVATGAYEKWLETWKPNGLWQSHDVDLWPETRALLPEADPIRRATNLYPCATLLINGGTDKVVDVSSTRAFVEAARPAYATNPDRLQLIVYDGMGHNLPDGVIPLYAGYWFRMHLASRAQSEEATAQPLNLLESTRQTALTPTPHERLIGATADLAAPASSVAPHSAIMPRPQDYTLLWWAEGPPNILGSSRPPATEVLCLQSGTWGMAIDTRKMELLRFGNFTSPMPLSTAMGPDQNAFNALPVSAWNCALVVGERRFQCTGLRRSKDEFFQPVQIVESGRFFQRVAITDLKLTDSQGQEFPESARLEISAWPDRLTFRLEMDPKSLREDARLELRVGERIASERVAQQAAVTLTVKEGPTDRAARLTAEVPLRIGLDETLGCYTIALPERPWSNAKGTYYPEEHLDRLDRWRLTLQNDSDDPVNSRLMFTQENYLPITGFTPFLADEEGRPTGIPVQISKNWHQRPEKGNLRHQGPWFHGCTIVRLPPHSHRTLTFSMAYARYGGVFAASHAQLSLIGWGHNQFWDQAAIGSFGESICFEPGRVQRRCFIDDMRPLLTLPETEHPKPYGWADNSGGGDFLMWQDAEGNYQPLRATRTNYRAYGPCLTDVSYSEETQGGEISAQMTVSLPRSDDYLRTFIHLRYDVNKRVQWRRLAFFQLGADHYNETPSRLVAVGDSSGLREEWEPRSRPAESGHNGRDLTGEMPWVSIHGLQENALRPGGAAVSRGLIIRKWKASFHGAASSAPYVSFWNKGAGANDDRTVVELSPPPTVRELQPGDFIEADLELAVFPAKPAAYYGPDVAFRAALWKNADQWKLIYREAAGNALRVEAQRGRMNWPYPMNLTVDTNQVAEVTVEGGLGYVPVTVNGVTSPHGFALWLDDRRVDQSIHGNDFWQTDYDSDRQQWRMTYNVALESSNRRRQTLRFAPNRAP